MTKTKALGGTQEWSGTSLNFQRGCRNDCAYCYEKRDASRRNKNKAGAITPAIWHDEAISITGEKFLRGEGPLPKLPPAKQPYMYPTTHDIHAENLENYLGLLRRALAGGNYVLVVSKPRMECVVRLCAELGSYRRQMLFRFTVGSANDEVLRFWEPNAPAFQERLSCLQLAYQQGYKTSVSCEPMLDNNIGAVVEAVRPCVWDHVWLGTMNGVFYAGTRDLRDDMRHLSSVKARLEQLIFTYQSRDNILALYERYKDDDLIRWKKSIKKTVGLPLQTLPDQEWFDRDPPAPASSPPS